MNLSSFLRWMTPIYQTYKLLKNTAMMHANGRDMAKLSLFDPEGRSVADPYYGDEQDFEQMYTHLQQIANRYITAWQLDHQALLV